MLLLQRIILQRLEMQVDHLFELLPCALFSLIPLLSVRAIRFMLTRAFDKLFI